METPVNTARVAGEPFSRARNTAPYALALAAVAAFSFLSGGYVIGRSTPVAVALLVAAAVWVWFLRRSTRRRCSSSRRWACSACSRCGPASPCSGRSARTSRGSRSTWRRSTSRSPRCSGSRRPRPAALDRRLRLPRRRRRRSASTRSSARCCPDVVTHAHTYARLDSPVGYWNVLALMMVMGLCVALSLAGDRATGAVLRTLAAAAAVPMCFAFFFTFSRGGWLALAVALVLYFAFSTTRLASFLSLVAVVTPVGARALAAPRPGDPLHRDHGRRVAHPAGRRPAAVGARRAAGHGRRPAGGGRCSTAPSAGRAGRHRRRGGRAGGRRRGRHRRFRALRASAWRRAVGQGQGARAGHRRARRRAGNAAGRAHRTDHHGRLPLWREAVQQSRYARAPAPARARSPSRTTASATTAAWSSTRTASGSTSSASSASSASCFSWRPSSSFWRRWWATRSRDGGDPLHPLLVALQAGVIAFVVHISWDWDWDMAAVGTVVFVLFAAASRTARRGASDLRRAERRAARAAVERRRGGSRSSEAPA